ncbi:hypothetical protein RB195_012058 [Necator americanus]|uniref:Uncharacterized protein n=1 Tax=Necator americanus TaxID=51031 RepID=A0ABR1D5C3_NECAM
MLQDLLRIDKMDDRWMCNKTNTAYISRRNLLSTNDECTVIHLTYVAPSALGFLQSNHVKFDTLCSSEKGMQVGVCGNCSRVVSTQSETVSMASRRRQTYMDQGTTLRHFAKTVVNLSSGLLLARLPIPRSRNVGCVELLLSLRDPAGGRTSAVHRSSTPSVTSTPLLGGKPLWMDFLAECFYEYGLFISKHPRAFALGPLILTCILALGAFNVRMEDDLRFLYSPEHSRSRLEYQVHKNFTGASSNK